ncbi:transcription factor Pcc1-domain-containing protein [Auriculariales sp. MPI-PUGE-AT-0066]|nr:transcription factor Pcc1-domain-containing protein [Auriculariales sp. MPI-PUGE-AT-0066]
MSAPAPAHDWHAVTIRVPFRSAQHATIAAKAIGVDSELQPHAVRRTLKVEDYILVTTFETLTIRLSRLTLNAFLENLDLVARTLSEFGDEAERSAQVKSVLKS